MFLDWQHFLNEATAFVDKVGVSYSRVTSGYSKGEYMAKLFKPPTVSYEQYNQYMLDNYGDSQIPTDHSYSRATKEEAKNQLINKIASYLSDRHKQQTKQKFSDLYAYYNENKERRESDITFDGQIGRSAIDYFNILNGSINEQNWAKEYLYKGKIRDSRKFLTSFKELYNSAKLTAKTEWLENNRKNADYINKRVSTFVFDEENIPQIAEFEAALNGETQKAAPYQSINVLKEIDLSKLPNTGFTKVGYRKDYFLNTPIALGRERELIFPNDDVHGSYFAVVELFEILASHNEVTFGNTKDYPLDANGKNVNDRNYTGDKNAQAKVVSVAQKLNANIIISTSATASGTPVISLDGIVVSGNNRTMSLKLAAANYKENYEQYKKVLYAEIEKGGYGISMAQVYQKFQNPVLVRFDVNFPSYTSTELNAFNKPRSKSEKNIDKAIRLSKQLNENEGCKKQLIELISEQEIVSELYNDRTAVGRFKNILLRCNIISENEMSAFFTDFSLTETGKILYQTLLISLVLNPASIEISQNDGVKSATKSVVNAILPLVKNKGYAKGSLIGEINNAMLVQNAMISGGYDKLAEFITENTLFKEDEAYKNEKSFVLNWYLNQRVNDLKNATLKYNNSLEANEGESLFGDSLSPDEIFNIIFTQEVDKDVLRSIETFKKHKGGTGAISKTEKYVSKETQPNELLLSRLQRAMKYL